MSSIELSKDEEQNVKKLAKDHFVVHGRLSISDLYRATSISLPADESYETIGGFLVAKMGKIPAKNASLEFEGRIFRVIEVEEKRIIKVDIKMIPKKD